MSSADQPLPEGTDHIIEGAGVSTDDPTMNEALEIEQSTAGQAQGGAAPGGSNAAGASGDDVTGALFGRFDDLKGQATDRARDLAQAGKDRATAALDDLVRMIEDAAGEVDSRIGSQYGDYARRAADGIGGFSEAFKDKDVDQIFDEARELVKKSPGVAIGVAAAIGFVVARVVRSGIPDSAVAANDANKDAPAA